MKRYLLISLITLTLLSIPKAGLAAVTEGISAGFVTTAPTDDPLGNSVGAVDGTGRVGKFTTPTDMGTLTEIGWWCEDATEAANFEVGIYDDNGGGATSIAVNLLSGVNRTNAKGTDAGWKRATVNISLSPDTIYWIAFQLDATATNTNTNGNAGGGRRDIDTGAATLADPWDSNSTSNNIIAIYALYTPRKTEFFNATLYDSTIY